MVWLLLCSFALLLKMSLVCNSEAGSVTYDARSLIIDGQHKILFSGSIHYPRSTPEVPLLHYIIIYILVLDWFSFPFSFEYPNSGFCFVKQNHSFLIVFGVGECSSRAGFSAAFYFSTFSHILIFLINFFKAHLKIIQRNEKAN